MSRRRLIVARQSLASAVAAASHARDDSELARAADTELLGAELTLRLTDATPLADRLERAREIGICEADGRAECREVMQLLDARLEVRA